MLEDKTNKEITDMLFDKADREGHDEQTDCLVSALVGLSRIDEEMRRLAKRHHEEMMQIYTLLLEEDDDK